MPSDFNKKAYILPNIGKGNYNTPMKLISNSLRFDLSDPAKFGLHVLTHYYKYGWKSTIAAFGVAKSTFYDWRRMFINSRKDINSLVPRCTRPSRVRTMMVNPNLKVTFPGFIRMDSIVVYINQESRRLI